MTVTQTTLQRRLRVVHGPRDVPVLGSDVRSKDVAGPCRLCEREAPLLLSHIVPRWAYRWAKAEGGEMWGTVHALGIHYREQDGNKHYLLCGQCEQYLGIAEAYLAMLARGRVTEMAAYGITLSPDAMLDGVRASLVRRGVLGILLKSHFAPSPPFTQVVLTDSHVASLRRRLLTDDYPVAGFPLLAIKWLGCVLPDANPRSNVVPAYRGNSFDLMMGGWSWTVLLKQQTSFLRELPYDCNLTPGNPWRVLVGDVALSNWFIEMRGEPDEAAEDSPWRDWPRDEPCPCGLGEGCYGDCCADTWCVEGSS